MTGFKAAEDAIDLALTFANPLVDELRGSWRSDVCSADEGNGSTIGIYLGAYDTVLDLGYAVDSVLRTCS